MSSGFKYLVQVVKIIDRIEIVFGFVVIDAELLVAIDEIDQGIIAV